MRLPFLLCVVTACSQPVTLESRARQLGLRLPADLVVGELNERDLHGAPGTVRLLASSVTHAARITATSHAEPAGATRFIAEQEKLLHAIFEPRLPPYPELINRATPCAPAFHPRPRPHPSGRWFALFAGERMGYGVCSDDLVRYRAGILYVHCPAVQRVFAVEMFAPLDGDHELSALMATTDCS